MFLEESGAIKKCRNKNEYIQKVKIIHQVKFKVRAILHPVCNKRHDWLILGGRKKEPISARLQTVFG